MLLISYVTGKLLLWDLKERRISQRIDTAANGVGCWSPDGFIVVNTGSSLIVYEGSSSSLFKRGRRKVKFILLDDTTISSRVEDGLKLCFVESAMGSPQTLPEVVHWFILATCLDGSIRVIKSTPGFRSLELWPLPPTSPIIASVVLPPFLAISSLRESMQHTTPCLVTLTETGHLHAYSLENPIRKLFLPPSFRISDICGLTTSVLGFEAQTALSKLQTITESASLPLSGGTVISSLVRSKTVIAIADSLSQIHLVLLSSPIPRYICQFNLGRLLSEHHHVHGISMDLEHDQKNMIVSAESDVLMFTYVPIVTEKDSDIMMAKLDETLDDALRESQVVSDLLKQQQNTFSAVVVEEGNDTNDTRDEKADVAKEEHLSTSSRTRPFMTVPQPESEINERSLDKNLNAGSNTIVESYPPSSSTQVQLGWWLSTKIIHQEKVVALDYAYWIHILATITESGTLNLIDISSSVDGARGSSLYSEAVYGTHYVFCS